MLQLDTLLFPNIGENGDLPLSGQTRLAETKARRSQAKGMGCVEFINVPTGVWYATSTGYRR
jgi:hypothetical protein